MWYVAPTLARSRIVQLSNGIMTKKSELYARRREMYRLYVDDLNMGEIIERLSTKYSVSKQALRRDWQKRTQWVYDVFDLEPASTKDPLRAVYKASDI